MPKFRTGSYRRGFTLLEMCAALFLTAVLGATVAFSTRGPLESARREQTIDRISLLDGRSRDRAVRTGKGQELVFDLDAHTLCARETGMAESHSAETIVCSAAAVVVGRERCESGLVIVAYDPSGRSSRFAVHLSDKKLPKEWLVFAPTTGQLVRTAGVEPW